MQALARFNAIPAAAGDGFSVIGGDRGHHPILRVVAPGEAGGGGLFDRCNHRLEEIGRLDRIGIEAARFQECGEGVLCLRAVDAVDGGRIIACDHQQPLDRGEARLLVVVLGPFGEIRDLMSVFAGAGFDFGERRCGLAAAALASGNDEVFRRNAEIVGAILRRGGCAVYRQRACMEQNALRRDVPLRDHAAGCRIDAEPAARRGRGLVLDADGGLDDITHAIADFKIGAGGGGESGEGDDHSRCNHAGAIANLPFVITGLVPVIPISWVMCSSSRDVRNRSGHDNRERWFVPHHLWISVPVP